MKIYINVKGLGKKSLFQKREMIISDDISDLKNFLTEIVTVEVKNYNEKPDDFLQILTNEEIENHANSGKVAFGTNYNGKKQDLQKALDNAFLSFEDGLFAVFYKDKKMENLDEKMQIAENDEFTFVKLTMLAGRRW